MPVFLSLAAFADAAKQKKGPPPVPVRAGTVREQTVSEQLTLIGTTAAIRQSTVAAEVPGLVEKLYVQEGNFIAKGSLLARLSSTELALRRKGFSAVRERIRANLALAEKELARVGSLKDKKSIAARKYDEALFNFKALGQDLMKSEAEIEQLDYAMSKKKVRSPFAGFIAKEHTQVGEWVQTGGSIVTLVDLSSIFITVDVSEKNAVKLSPKSEVKVFIKSLSTQPLSAKIAAVLPQGNPASRTFPVRIKLPNRNLEIKSGMEAMVAFELGETKSVLLVPKDAVVPAGNDRLVFKVNSAKAYPVKVDVLGYYGSDVAVRGDLKPGEAVVIRGNERLRPGQAVKVVD